MASPAAERYLASLPPDDQAAIRAGGDVDAWYNAAVQAGAVPSQFSGQGGAKDPSQWNVDAGGGRNWWDTTAEQAGINPWQQDYKQEFERTNSQMLAQMSPEQRARWSMEHIDDLSANSDWSPEQRWRQWMYWQDSFDPKCPPNAPYQASDGSGCVEKPDNSNKGYQEGQGGEGGPGGGGSGQGKGPSDSAYFGQDDPLQRYLTNILSNRGGQAADIQSGMQLQGGGVFWTPGGAAQPEQAPAPAPRPPRPRNQPPQEGAFTEVAGITKPEVSGGGEWTGSTLNVGGAGVAPMFQAQPQNLEDMMTRRARKMSGNSAWQGAWF